MKKKIFMLLTAATILVMAGCQGSVQTDGPAAAVTDAPKVTDTPEATDAPEVTDTPEPTDMPQATNAPEKTDTPEVTDAPKVTDMPKTTPVLTPKPTATPTNTPAPTPMAEATDASAFIMYEQKDDGTVRIAGLFPQITTTKDESMQVVVIPEKIDGKTVTEIGIAAFKNCRSLTSVTIPGSVTEIGDRAFRNCSSLTSFQVAAENANYKSENGSLYSKDGTVLYALAASADKTEFTIPDGVTKIEDWAFANGSSLTSVMIPGSVTWIGNYAFFDCSSLTSVTIPGSVTWIGRDAFYRNLTTVHAPRGSFAEHWALVKGYSVEN